MMIGCLVCAAIRPHAGVSAVRRQRSKAECSLDVATVETPRPLGTRLLSDLVRGVRQQGVCNERVLMPAPNGCNDTDQSGVGMRSESAEATGGEAGDGCSRWASCLRLSASGFLVSASWVGSR